MRAEPSLSPGEGVSCLFPNLFRIEKRNFMAVRKAFVAGNWKMNKTVAEAVALAEELNGLVGQTASVDMAVCPTYTAL
jgi:hypothetical protein